MNTIKALLFDFGGTLDNDGRDWFTRLHGLAQTFGETMDRDAFKVHADDAGAFLATLDDTPRLTMEQTAHRLCQQIHRLATQARADGPLAWQPQAVVERFMAQAREYLHRNHPVLAELARRFRLGCISNNWGNAAGWCREFRFDEHFHTVIDSTVVGAAKPAEAIFTAALTALDLPASACAYVGDSYPADMVGAHQAGLKTIWLTRPDTPCPDDSIIDYRIEQLPDLLTLF